MGDIDRRRLLTLAGAALFVGACSEGGSPGTRSSAGGGAATTAPRTPRPSPSPTLPAVARYSPLPGEPLPNLKQVAADFAQGLTTRQDGQEPAEVLAGLAGLTSPAFDVQAALAAALPIYPEAASTGEVVYPQLGGLRPLGQGATSASVMVVVRQRHLGPDRALVDVVRTMDVRLAVEGGTWKVVELASAGGDPVERPADTDPRVARALDHPDLDLPDSAVWDVHAGRVSPDLLDLLAGLADVSPVSVAVLRTGHPVNVFGTDRLSNHTEGRAVDVWAVGGQPVVTAGAAAGPAAAALRAAFDDARLAQAGSPVGSDLDGGGRRSFNDLVHADHLHLAVRGGGSSGG